MIVQTIKVNDCTPQTIVIGRRGTYDTLQIAFDLSYLVESYGNGVAVLAVKRSQDSSAYPAVTAQEDNTLTWTISETDTFYPGLGKCELMWYVEGGLAKTVIYPIIVMKDILATSEEAPDAYQTWVDDLTALGAETLQNAQDAAQSASDAETAKDDAVAAKEAAEEAASMLQNVSATATTLDPNQPATASYNDGEFTFGIPKGDKGDKLTYADLTEADKLDLIQGPIADAQADAEQAVEDKGDEVIASIPEDYTELVDEVSDVKNAIDELEYEVEKTPQVKESDVEDVDLDISDTSGNVVLRIEAGEIKTKNFDSEKSAGLTNSDAEADFDIADPDGNVLVRFKNGHVMTKNFTSQDILARTTYITVKKNGGDFSTLRGAIESINTAGDADPIEHPYVIQVYPGTYNLTDEYTQSEIEAADVTDYHNGFVGWMLNDGISLAGIGNRDEIVLSCQLDTTIYNARIRGNVSTLNLEGNVSLENLTVIAVNVRYCVHDDFVFTGSGQYFRHVKNCNFIGESLAHSPACTWGGGMSAQGENALYENCDFGTDYGHHFDATESVHITFRNCRGRKLRLAERNSNARHYVVIENSDFGMISLLRPSNVTEQHIMVQSTGCEYAFVSCYDNDIILTGAITKTQLNSLPVGTLVAISQNSGNNYVPTNNIGIADGVVVANDLYYTYIQRVGYINTRILGLENYAVGDFITIDSNNKLVRGGSEANAIGEITFISYDSDVPDQGVGFIKLFVGGKNNG